MPPKPPQNPFPIHVQVDEHFGLTCAHCHQQLQPHHLGMLWHNPVDDDWLPICWNCTKAIASILLLTTDLADSDITIAVL